MRFGRVVLDEVPMEITDVELRCGEVRVSAATTDFSGSLNYDAELTLFAPDGTVVLHRSGRAPGRVLKVFDGDSVTLTWRWHLVAQPDRHTVEATTYHRCEGP